MNTDTYKNALKVNIYDAEGIKIPLSDEVLQTSTVTHTKTRGSFLYIMLDMYAVCPKCDNRLIKSDLPEYKYLCKECDENFYSIEVKKFRDSSKLLVKGIEREFKIIEAIWNKTITFSNDGEGDIVCHIGDYWLYFYEGPGDAWEITPDNIHTHTELIPLATMIRNAIEVLDDAEYRYYADILGWEVA